MVSWSFHKLTSTTTTVITVTLHAAITEILKKFKMIFNTTTAIDISDFSLTSQFYLALFQVVICSRNWVSGPGSKIHYLVPKPSISYPFFCTDYWKNWYNSHFTLPLWQFCSAKEVQLQPFLLTDLYRAYIIFDIVDKLWMFYTNNLTFWKKYIV